MFPIRDHNHSHKFPFLTLLIILACAYVFFLQLTAVDPEAFVFAYGLVPAKLDLLDPSTWLPVFSSMFMHGGWLHIISNMWFLWIFGDNIEATLGRLRYLLFYLTSGVAAALAQYLLSPASEIPMIGASGAIAGVLGGYLVLFPRAKIETLIVGFGLYMTTVNVPAQLMLFYWFLTQVFSGVGSVASGVHNEGGVAFFAHIGGFVAGWVMMRLMKVQSPVVELERIE
jgi:membrane associated rhomboid family serine protease